MSAYLFHLVFPLPVFKCLPPLLSCQAGHTVGGWPGPYLSQLAGKFPRRQGRVVLMRPWASQAQEQHSKRFPISVKSKHWILNFPEHNNF